MRCEVRFADQIMVVGKPAATRTLTTIFAPPCCWRNGRNYAHGICPARDKESFDEVAVRVLCAAKKEGGIVDDPATSKVQTYSSGNGGSHEPV